MLRRVVFSKTALKRLFILLEYLEDKWSIKVRDEFEEKLNHSIETIVLLPEIFPKSEYRKNDHKCVVSKQTIFFYRFNSKKIFIAEIIDTRKDPKNIKKV